MKKNGKKLQPGESSVVERKIDRLADAMVILTSKVDGLKESVGGLDKRVGGLEESVGGLDKRVGGLEENVGGLKQNVGGLQESVGGLAGKMDNMQYQMHGFQEQMVGVQDKISSLDGILKITDKRLDVIEDDMVTKDHFKHAFSLLVTKDDFQNLETHVYENLLTKAEFEDRFDDFHDALEEKVA
ncbi:MAG: hypothetical protein AAB373_04455 [Patescibacteria group bacterium]